MGDKMTFENMRIKSIESVVTYIPDITRWETVDRQNHIIGVHIGGESIHDLGYQKFTMSDNCIYFLNQRDDYSVELIEKGKAFSVHFTTYEEIETDSFCIKLEDVSEIFALWEKIRKQHSLTSKGDNLTLSYLYRLCAMYENICAKPYSQKEERLTDAKNFIDLNFTDKDCLGKATETVKVTRRRFNELFKKHYNVTPNRYIVMRKIELAKTLLKENALSVSEVADMCGFSDVYYFSKTFKVETDFSPTEYKKAQMR